MNSRERLLNRLEGKSVDRVPNMNILMTFSAYKNNVPYSEYVTDYKKLVECDIECSRKYGIDLLCSISDPVREAEGLGCKVNIPHDDVPHVIKVAIEEITDVGKIKAVNPNDSKRMADRILSVSYFKQKAGNEFAVSGWVEGAFAESCDVRGINDFMVDVLDEDNEQYVLELLEKCYEQSAAFAMSQIQAGADIIGIGDAAASLVGIDTYAKFALPYQTRMIKAIHAAGAKVKLHICGNITRHLKMIASAKPDIVDIDWMNDYKYAVSILEPYGICANGNYDPVAIMLQAKTDKVAESVRACRDLSGKFGAVSAGCEVPKFTSEENLMAAYNALKS